jgi:hypothetical protein
LKDTLFTENCIFKGQKNPNLEAPGFKPTYAEGSFKTTYKYTHWLNLSNVCPLFLVMLVSELYAQKNQRALEMYRKTWYVSLNT